MADGLLKKIGIGILGLGMSTGLFGQEKAELEMILKRPDLEPAKGTITVTGPDSSIVDTNYTGNKVYILDSVTGIDDPIAGDKKITYGPNPVNGFLNLNFNNYERLEGIIEAYAYDGKKIGQIDLAKDNHMNINAAEGIVILQYKNLKTGENDFIKLVNKGNVISTNINLGSDNGATQVPESNLKGAVTKNYEGSFEDPTGNLETVNWNFDVDINERYTIDEVLQWKQKNISWEAATNNQTTVKAVDLADYEQVDEAFSADGNISERSITKRFNNEEGLDVEYSLTAPYTDTAKFSFKQFMNDKVVMDTIRNGHFHLTLTGNGDNYIIKHEGNVVASGAVGSESFFKLQKDLAALELISQGTGLIPDTAYVDMNKGVLTQDMQLEEIPPNQYQRGISGELSSSLGKLIAPNTKVGFARVGKDTLFAYTDTQGQFNLSYISLNPLSDTGKIVIPSVIGHNAGIEDAIIVDETNEAYAKELVGTQTNKDVEVLVSDADQGNVAGALAQMRGLQAYANTQGLATFQDVPLITGIYNQDTANIEQISINRGTAGHDFAQKTLDDVNISSTSQIQGIVAFINEFFAYSNNSSNTGNMNVKVEKDGQNISEGNSDANGNFSTTKHYSTDLEVQANRIIFSKPDFTNQELTNVIMHDGGDEINNIVLQKPYVVNVSLVNSDGKTELGGRIYVMEGTDTLDVQNITGTNGQLQFTSPEESLEAIVGVRNVPYFNGSQASTTLTGNNNVDANTNAITYFFDVSGTATHQTQGPASGRVEVDGQSDDLDANGDYAIQNLVQERGSNNERVDFARTAILYGVQDTISKGLTVNEDTEVVDFDNVPDIASNVDLEVGHADHRADNWINEGTYHVRTDDGIEHIFPITSGVQTFTLVGPYDANTSAKTWVEGVTGKENLVQTYVANFSQPIASNGMRDDTLSTTLGALDGRIVYNLVMDTDVFNDADLRARIGGGKEYDGEVNGHRGMMRELLMQRVVGVLPDYSDYIYADDLTVDEKTSLRENSALFDQPFMNRGIGYVIMESQEQEVQTDDGNGYAKTKIRYDTRGSPGNTHHSSGTNTYDSGIGSVPEWNNFANLTGEWYETVLFPNEAAEGRITTYSHSGTSPYSPSLTEAGEDIATIILTYKGGQAPRE